MHTVWQLHIISKGTMILDSQKMNKGFTTAPKELCDDHDFQLKSFAASEPPLSSLHIDIPPDAPPER